MFGLFSFWLPLLFIIQIYYLLPNRQLKNLCLLIASWVFYISIDYRVFPLLLISTLTDWTAGFLVSPSQKKTIRFFGLFSSLVINLGLLCIFKYLPEMLNTENSFKSLLQTVGLPLGISFYTFQTIGYTIDCYRGHIKPTKDILSFALYVSFFPQLVAGPIEKSKRLLPQFQKDTTLANLKQFKEGFYLVLLGLFKKIYVAEGLNLPLNRIFTLEETNPPFALLGGFLAILHLYIDFSAYSDLARGIAKFFGVELMINFKPFIFSKNPIDFWRSWHISLYQWIRYYPIRTLIQIMKNKKYNFKALYIIVFMLIFSFWHKASINMFINGLFNGFSILISIYFIRRDIGSLLPKIFKYLGIFVIMFLYYTIKGLLYYSKNFEHLISIVFKIFEFQGFGRETTDLLIYLFPLLTPLFIYELFQKKYESALFILKAPIIFRAFWCAFVFACIFIFERGTYTQFIYFGF